ncbi:MAG: hypothetical protein ISS19_13075 [Bacteroidales bacterium]|nr:hypothetical protein [Bacteroidales bacterium]
MRIIIDHLKPEHYDLNTCDIWYFERLYFLNIKKDIELGQRIINEIQSLIVNNTDPAYDIKFYDEGDANAKRKYHQNVRTLLNNVRFLIRKVSLKLSL